MYVDHPRLSGCRGCTGRNSRPASAARNAAPGAQGRSSRRRRGRTGRAAALPGRRCTPAGCDTGFAAAAAAARWLRAACACSRLSGEEIRTAARIAPAQACSRARCSSLSAGNASSPWQVISYRVVRAARAVACRTRRMAGSRRPPRRGSLSARRGGRRWTCICLTVSRSFRAGCAGQQWSRGVTDVIRSRPPVPFCSSDYSELWFRLSSEPKEEAVT